MDPKQVTAIQRWVALFCPPGQAVELRALQVGGRRAVCEVFGDIALLARRAADLDAQGAQGVYFTPNPLRADLVGGTASCKKADVLRRHWLLLDCDPLRPAKLSASDPEKAQAWAVLCRARDLLDGAGLARAVVADSGNGWHLCYPLLLPNDDASQALVKAALKGLQARCGDQPTKEQLEALKTGPLPAPLAKVEEDVFDATRIWKVYGTRARKGEPTPERPHRWTRLIEGEPWDEAVAAANAEALRQLVSLWQRADEMRRGRPETNAATYAAAALKRECELVANAPPQGWNSQLFKSAAATSEFVASGALTRPAVEQALADASRRRGHEDAEVAATIASGFNHGLQHPRDLSGVNGQASAPRSSRPTTNDEPRRVVAADNIATIADLVEAGAKVQWLWEWWIQVGVLTAIAAPGGTGKTRFCADLLRRIRYQLPWPDGTPMTIPADVLALWVASDNNHDELVTLSQAFGIADMIRLNAFKDNPYGGVTLDEPDDIKELDQRVGILKPAIVIVDTVGQATDRNLSRQEEAKAFYFPLQIIARKHRCALLCLTHLNATGQFLGRRVLEKVRVALKMEQPDPDNDKRRLEVYKTNSKKPEPLGLTMDDTGNEYDHQPPKSPEEPGQKRGPVPAALKAAMHWLQEHLSTGPKKVGNTRTAAEMEGITKTTLYRAKDNLGVEEYKSEGLKWWKFTSTDSDSDPFAQDVPHS